MFKYKRVFLVERNELKLTIENEKSMHRIRSYDLRLNGQSIKTQTRLRLLPGCLKLMRERERKREKEAGLL